MKKRKLTIFAIFLIQLLCFTGCVQTPEPMGSTITKDQAASAPKAFDNFVDGITNSLIGKFIYSGRDASPYDLGYFGLMLTRDMMGQDMVPEDTGNEFFNTWYACGTGLGEKYALCQLPWTYYYGWIKNCNQVIDLAGETPKPGLVAGAGIAYAYRALFYMELAQMFATKTYIKDKKAPTVPYVSEKTTNKDLVNNPRMSNEEMWKRIVADLDLAEKFLAKYKRPDLSIPDLSVVYGLKARAYLIMGDWAKAENYAKQAQNGYKTMTAAQYTDRNNAFNTPNESWMLALTYKKTDPAMLTNDGDTSWGSQMILEVQPSGMGYAANYGAPKKIDYHLYQTIPATDCRKKCYIDFALDKLSREEQAAKLKEYSDVGESILKTVENLKSKSLGGLQLKFRPKGGEHKNQYAAWEVSVPIMRVEEMKLIEAEAAGMQNEEKGKQLLIAFAKTRDPQYEYGKHQEAYGSKDATSFQNEVWWQRRVEFWGEGLATFDIKRLNKGVIRSYANTNHIETNRWNFGTYGVNEGNMYPNWMDLCIIGTEGNFNTAIVNNPTPLKPSSVSKEYVW